MKQKVLKVHPNDNVLVALTDLKKGEAINYSGEEYIPTGDVSAKHKFVTIDLQPGDEVIMYGGLVGKAQTAIAKGEVITTANVKHAASPYYYRPSDYKWVAPDVSKFANRTFNGYHRSNGDVGTAN